MFTSEVYFRLSVVSKIHKLKTLKLSFPKELLNKTAPLFTGQVSEVYQMNLATNMHTSQNKLSKSGHTLEDLTSKLKAKLSKIKKKTEPKPPLHMTCYL